MAFRKLKAYQKGFDLAMEIFELSKSFPKEETYSLTDQTGGHHDQFVLIWQSLIEKGFIQNIL